MHPLLATSTTNAQQMMINTALHQFGGGMLHELGSLAGRFWWVAPILGLFLAIDVALSKPKRRKRRATR